MQVGTNIQAPWEANAETSHVQTQQSSHGMLTDYDCPSNYIHMCLLYSFEHVCVSLEQYAKIYIEHGTSVRGGNTWGSRNVVGQLLRCHRMPSYSQSAANTCANYLLRAGRWTRKHTCLRQEARGGGNRFRRPSKGAARVFAPRVLPWPGCNNIMLRATSVTRVIHCQAPQLLLSMQIHTHNMHT